MKENILFHMQISILKGKNQERYLVESWSWAAKLEIRKLKVYQYYLLNLLLDLLQKLKCPFTIGVVRVNQAFPDLNKSPGQLSLDYLMKGLEFEEEKRRKRFKLFFYGVLLSANQISGFIYQHFNQNKSVHLSDFRPAIRHLIKDESDFPILDGCDQAFLGVLTMVTKLGKMLTYLERLPPLKLYDDCLMI